MVNFASIMNGTATLPTTVNPSLYPYEAQLGVVCVWLIASVLGLVGNSLVISSVILSKKLRTVTNAFVVNLSVADFWTSLSYPWICVALLSHGSWPLESEVPCIIAAVQFYTGLGASLYTLASIALNRVVLITQSVETYRRWFSPCKVTAMIAATWAIPCAVFFLPPILGTGEFGYDPQDNTCSDKDGHARGAEYNLAQSLGLYPVPMIIIVCCYTALYIHLKKHFRRQKKRSAVNGTPPFAAAVSGDGEVPNTFTVISEDSSGDIAVKHAIARNRRAISRRQLAITKNLFVVFCTFTVLLSPYFISLAVPAGRKFAIYGATIAILNSCVNPIIYTINHPQFKVVLRKMIQCHYSEIPEPSDCLKSVLTLRKK